MNTDNHGIIIQLGAAEFLEGVELESGWKVVSKAPQAVNSTGGCFSIPYIVERRNGNTVQKAFMKVLNLRRLMMASDFAREMERMTSAFNFERDTLLLCKDRKLRRVASLIHDGQHRLPNNPFPICYIIFELATGDIRKQIESFKDFQLAWRLRTLHQISVGLRQLHGAGLAHQDLKPSNVLIFEHFGAKIGDLGCADSGISPNTSPRGHLPFAGDPAYAPPELLYNEVSTNWQTRRIACDLYLYGNLVVFFFSNGASMTGLIHQHLNPSHTWAQWPHDYRTVLPYIYDAFEKAIETVARDIPAEIRSPLVEIVRQQCDPDPKRRGDRSNSNDQLRLDRLVSRMDLLATRAEHGLPVS